MRAHILWSQIRIEKKVLRSQNPSLGHAIPSKRQTKLYLITPKVCVHTFSCIQFYVSKFWCYAFVELISWESSTISDVISLYICFQQLVSEWDSSISWLGLKL
jgi:hypothetical protein